MSEVGRGLHGLRCIRRCIRRCIHLVDDQDHPQMVEICAELKRLHVEMEEVEYFPDTRIVLHDVEEEEKVFHLLHHSEKLAIAFGLISSPHCTPICFFKNLQVCGEGHTATKFISKLVGRTIIG
jgi:hypothetical protein